MSTAASPTRPWRLLVGAAREPGSGLGVVLGALVISTALPLTGPLLLRRFIDQAPRPGAAGAMTLTAVAYLVVAVLTQTIKVLTVYAGSRWSWRATNRLREQLADHVLRLDYSFHGRHTAGEMIERVDGDIIGLTQFLSQFVLQAAGSALLLLGALVVITLQDARLGVAFGALVVVGGLIVWRGQRGIVPLAAAEREAFAQLYGGIEEHIAGAEDIRANGAGAHILMRFHETANDAFHAGFRFQRWSGTLLGATNAFFALGTVGLLAAGAELHSRGAISLGTVVALFEYSRLMRGPVEQIVGQAKQFQEAAASTGRVAQLLSERPTIVDAAAAAPLASGPLGVHLRNVSFAYGDDLPVLHDIDLTIEAGRSLGLVGRTGSGKTTIGRLVLRLYDPTEGSVEVGGLDLRAARTADVRRRVRAVSQDVQLFGATVADNVTLFDASVSAAEVERVLRAVGLDAWLAGLPEGVHSLLGPNGNGMSAGEAQLLALSRIFLADPAVVVLDEPSSRLDPATEHLVEIATAELLRGRTAVVIAHRVAALAHVDEIAVLDDGRVVERGPRAALLADPSSRVCRLLEPERAPR